MSATTPGPRDPDAGELEGAPGDALDGDIEGPADDVVVSEEALGPEDDEDDEDDEDEDLEDGEDLATGEEPSGTPAGKLTPSGGDRVASPRPRSGGTIRSGDAAKAAAAVPTRRGKGRTTPKGGVPVRATSRTGRYTHPIPREQRQSPRWYPFVLLAFLILGLLTIVLNYVNVLPGGTNNWYLIGGIVAIVVGLFMATFYH